MLFHLWRATAYRLTRSHKGAVRESPASVVIAIYRDWRLAGWTRRRLLFAGQVYRRLRHQSSTVKPLYQPCTC